MFQYFTTDHPNIERPVWKLVLSDDGAELTHPELVEAPDPTEPDLSTADPVEGD